MKTKLLNLCVVSVIFFGACTNTPKKQESTEAAEEKNEMKMDNTHMEEDAEFMVKAADGGMFEVALGKLAEKNGKMQEVKNFGKMMAEHHSKINDELKALAATKNITVPADMSDDNHKKMEKFSNEAGHDFDKDYIDEMIDAHEKDIKAFEDKASDEKCDADIKHWVTETLPTLRTHLADIKMIKEKCEKMKK